MTTCAESTSTSSSPPEELVFTSALNDLFVLGDEKVLIITDSGSELSLRVTSLTEFLYEARRCKIAALVDALYP